MFKIRAFVYVGIFLSSCFFAGCGIRPQIDFYVKPIAFGEEQRIDRETGSVTVENEEVSITISASAFTCSSEYTIPVGLHGELSKISFVLPVMLSAIFSTGSSKSG